MRPNLKLKDDILRVVRDPIRKLARHERLVAPALLAEEYGLARRWIVAGIVAALRYRHPADAQSLALGEQLALHGPDTVLEHVCGIQPDSALAVELRQVYRI